MTSVDTTSDATTVVDRLADQRLPFLIGVRHHSPVLAAAVPALLDVVDPDAVLVELPLELEPWLSWLGHTDLTAPVALAVADASGARLGFYPFADFSPELAAIRWAIERGVPVHAIDLPAQIDAATIPLPAASDDGSVDREPAASRRGPGVVELLLHRHEVPDVDELWDRLVEVASYGADAEQIRRAALGVGWLLRSGASDHQVLDSSSDPPDRGVAHRDLVREAWMRHRTRQLIDAGVRRPAAVVGSFHATALAPRPDDVDWPPIDREGIAASVAGAGALPDGSVTSLVPYSFDLLDSRSGYPAGIRDPVWQQRVFAAGGDPDLISIAATELVVAICADLRRDGHVAGVPDARECVRMAGDLASLRGLAAPGRREVVESIQVALGQGELLGRGRALARAAERTLIGSRHGALPPTAPISGVQLDATRVLADLGLPGPDSPPEAVELRLDPMRSGRDRQRQIVLARLRACRVVYGEERILAGVGGRDPIGRSWTVRWTPSSAATLAFAGVFGVTLEQAASGSLRRRWQELQDAEELLPASVLDLVAEAGECGARDLLSTWTASLPHTFLPAAGLSDVIAAHALLERVAAGHVPGVPVDGPDAFVLPPHPTPADLLASAITAAEGVAGSDDIGDVAALLALTQIVERQRADAGALGEGRLQALLDGFADDGSPLMQGAALGASAVLAHVEPASIGRRASSWIDAPVDGDAAKALARRLSGILATIAPLIETAPDLLDPLADRIEQIDDDTFLARLPSLREGFDVLSPAARDRFLAAVADRLGIEDIADVQRSMTVTVDPTVLVENAAADARGRGAVAIDDPGLLAIIDATAGVDPDAADDEGAAARDRPATPRPVTTIAPLDRWRLVLGRQREQLTGANRRMGHALDELYGSGHGEGSGRDLGPDGRGGGQDAPFPTAREWGDEIEALFGAKVREEVLGRAAERGRTDALLALDPDAVTPSVDLLQHVLSLKGALPESKLEPLRRLVRRIVDELTKELAQRLRPALSGLTIHHPSPRPVGPLDLRRTIRANLHTARIGADGLPGLAPERWVFRSRARRSADWHVFLVVDVSGSMEPSVIYSALVAAIVDGLPALSVHFVSFSTEVIDLTDLVDDPLSLLLEVSVGGGTDIGKGLRYAREQLTVPSRSLVLLVSDFEEGCSVGRLVSEVRAIVGTGARALGLAALDDRGEPSFNRGIAEQAAAAGMPVAALTPLELARWIGEQVRA